MQEVRCGRAGGKRRRETGQGVRVWIHTFPTCETSPALLGTCGQCWADGNQHGWRGVAWKGESSYVLSVILLFIL